MSRRAITWLVVIALLLGLAGFGVWRLYARFTEALISERCYLQLDDSEDPLLITDTQAENAAIIVAASYEAGLPEQAAVIALATAWQESGLRNLDYGDRDSLGLFQQRPSQGWGTEEEILDPWYSSAAFYEALVKIDGWETGDVTEVAQAVQISAYPEAYRKHEENARALAGAFRGTRPASLACVDRSESAADASQFSTVVATVPDVTVEETETGVTFRSENSEALWSATQLALAYTDSAGISSATLLDNYWEQGSRTSWRTTNDPGPDGVATLTLGAE